MNEVRTVNIFHNLKDSAEEIGLQLRSTSDLFQVILPNEKRPVSIFSSQSLREIKIFLDGFDRALSLEVEAKRKLIDLVLDNRSQEDKDIPF